MYYFLHEITFLATYRKSLSLSVAQEEKKPQKTKKSDKILLSEITNFKDKTRCKGAVFAELDF